MRRTLVCLPLLALAACSSPAPVDAGADATSDATSDIAADTNAVLDAQDAGPPSFDSGPAPACSVTASARHILDRPGSDRVREPSALVAVPGGGFLVGLRRYDLASRDGGAPDAAVAPFTTDSVDLIALAEDGSPRGPAVSLFDSVSRGTTLDDPLLFATTTGAYVIFREQRGLNASDPNFFIRLRATSVDAVGTGAPTVVLREDYARPNMTRLSSGNLFGVASRIDSIADGGIPALSPVSMYLGPDGTNLRGSDVDINAFVPVDSTHIAVRATDDGGAVYVARTNGHLGFLRFNPSGGLDLHGIYDVRGASIPRLDDAASAGDGVVGVWTLGTGSRSEVHVIVAGLDGSLRLDREIENFSGEGPTVATAINAYGGVALLWRRGVDANARVRIAVVAPDGSIRVNPTDLVRAANIEGHILAQASGRTISFVVQDGLPPLWGYTFGRACIPGM